MVAPEIRHLETDTSIGSAIRYRHTLGQGIVVFWGVWLAIVFASNACDALVQFQILPASWPFASGNYSAVSQTTLRYQCPAVINAILFIGVIVWEGAAAILFFRAALLYRADSQDSARDAMFLAFSASLALWGAFVLADEFLIAYALEAPHLRLFIAQLLSLLYLELIAFKS